MKKLVAVFLVLVMAVNLCGMACADEFKLRNGILFGDTIDDIVAKEKTLTRESDTSNSFKGKIAGYSDAECTFGFDDDGKLVTMNYSFSSDICTSRDKMNEVYKTIYESLNRQYGSPLGYTGGSCYLITGPAFTSMAVWVYWLGELDGCAGDYTDYDEWVVDADGYHVKIDMISYYYRDNKYNYQYMVNVSYKMFTDDEYAEALSEKQGEREEVDNDF